MYWIGGNGNFNDYHHWSLVSGGQSCKKVPSETTPVIFDNNSGKGFVTIAFGEVSKLGSLNTYNTSNKLIFTSLPTSKIFISGSIHLSRLVDFKCKGRILFSSENTQFQEIDFGNRELPTDLSFDKGIYQISSLQLSGENTLRFGSGEYYIQNTALSVGNFINDDPAAKFHFENAYLKVASEFKVKSEQDFSFAGLYLILDGQQNVNAVIPPSLASAKNFTSVNSTNVVCPVTISVSPACSGSCTGVLTVSLSTTCTNTPYSVFVTNASCPSYTAALTNTNVTSVFTVTNACSCNLANYQLIVRDASNTVQAFNTINFVPTAAVLFDNNISTCSTTCNGALRGTILGSSPFTVSVISSSTTVSNFTTASGDYTVSNLCSGNYTLVITDVNGCLSTVPQTLFGIAGPVISASSGSICSGASFNLSPSGATNYTIIGGSPVVSPTVTTTYTILGSNGGCQGSTISTVSVSPLPTITVPTGSICNGSSFTLSPSGAVSYTIAGGSAVVTPSVTSNYSVSGTSTDGCSSGTLVTVTVNQLPLLTVNSGTICAGSSFTMIPGGASTYTYSSGSAIVSPGSNASFSVIGTSSQGCVSMLPAVSNVTVNPLPVVSVNSGSVCLGSTFTITPGGALTYTVSGGSAMVTPTTTTNYSVTGTGTNGCRSVIPAIASVTVVVSPVATVTSNSPLCEGGSLTMLVNAPGATSYLWSGPLGYQSFFQNPVISPVTQANNGSYTVTSSFNYGSLSCTTSVVHPVQVLTLPLITVTDGTICSGQTFVINPSGAVSYSYSGGTSSVSPLVSSSYTITGTGANTCSNTAVIHVLVNPLPILQVNSGTVCAGGSFTLNPSGASSYTFSTGNPVINPLSTLGYSVTGTSSLGCVSFSPATGLVMVYPSPTIYPFSTNSLICGGETATISALGLLTYTWSNGLVGPSIIVNPNQTTTYTLSGTDGNGCYASAQFVQNVDACLGLSFVDSNGLIQIYPNPFRNEFSVQTNQDSEITIMNALGQVILTQHITSGENKMDLIKYAGGIYFVQVKQGSVLKLLKLVKE